MANDWNNEGAKEGAVAGASMGTAISPGWGTVIGGAAGGILGGFFSGDKGEDQYAEQQRLMEETLRELEGIPLPELEKIAYENPRWLDDLVAVKQAESKMNQIAVDPRLKNQQLAAMSALDEIVQGGGLTAMDRANLNRVQTDAATQDRGRREAILQSMNQRGMGGSGLELLNQLQSSQAATDRASQQGLDIAGMAQQRALNALMNQGQMAGQMRGQEFGEQAQIAAANDAINRFNAQNQMQAREFNVGGRQNTANAGVDLRNRAMEYNAQIPQRTFQNQMDIAAARGQARGQNIDMIGQKRAEDIQTRANQMGAATKIGTTAFSSMNRGNQNQAQENNQASLLGENDYDDRKLKNYQNYA